MMQAVISSHLMAAELESLEAEIARLRVPAAETEALMRMNLSSHSAQTLADCKHLEVTLQAVRCEHCSGCRIQRVANRRRAGAQPPPAFSLRRMR